MRLHVHDFSGHPFQVELSRELAGRGHRVHHSYCDRYVSGKGALTATADDPASFSIAPVSGDLPFDKYDPKRRMSFEIAYARALSQTLAAQPLDAVVLCNLPLITTYLVKRALQRHRLPWVFWHQDVYSAGMREELGRRLPAGLGGSIGGVFGRMERACVRDADAVVAIDDVFVEQYRTWGLDSRHVAVIPNWAPIAEIVPTRRDNGWARAHRLPDGALRLLYSGMLGRKHNPLLLLDLLRRTRAAGVDVHLTVVSEGDGVDLLRSEARPEDGVLFLPFQDAGRFSEVLSAADVLVTLLEPAASRFSIPSKVLSYLSAGRPVVGLMPGGNTAAGAIRSVGGVTAEPDGTGVGVLVAWLTELAESPSTVARLGLAARCHAEREFDIRTIGDRFDAVVGAAARRNVSLLRPLVAAATPPRPSRQG